MKKFKSIYIEITNICNLNCSFCSNDNIEKKSITISEFEHILKEINDYTDYIYLQSFFFLLMSEPTMLLVLLS